MKPPPRPGVGARVRSDPEAAAPQAAELEDHQRVWKFLSYLIMNICLIVGAYMTAMNDEGGAGFDHVPLTNSSSHVFPQFDFKWALWCALGGGLSGAAGMNIQYTC